MTKSLPQPDGYSTVSAYIMADGAERVIDFAVGVFGAQELMRLPREGGGINHASIRIGDSVVMIADAIPSYPAVPTWLHVYVPDVDAAYETALALGGTSVEPPASKGDGDRRCGVRDPAGNTWWIATPVV